MKKIITALTVALFTTAAYAAGPSFAEADVNQDGLVSMEEAKVALPDADEAKIAAADANGDGGLNEEEYTALTAS
ncbi:hypothetical protein ACFQ14_14490 [Pseudahrensia aquimaris]|uniref:EF-hand domain-containing protein n=1 Tax=Pseudahrensia aquimaris TaxID=744461 RepID=A0ABW3FGI3_9HYPH